MKRWNQINRPRKQRSAFNTSTSRSEVTVRIRQKLALLLRQTTLLWHNFFFFFTHAPWWQGVEQNRSNYQKQWHGVCLLPCNIKASILALLYPSIRPQSSNLFTKNPLLASTNYLERWQRLLPLAALFITWRLLGFNEKCAGKVTNVTLCCFASFI